MVRSVAEPRFWLVISGMLNELERGAGHQGVVGKVDRWWCALGAVRERPFRLGR